MEIDGKAIEFPDRAPTWVIKGDKVIYGGQTLAVLTLDASSSPKSIDLGFLDRKRVFEGIYTVADDTLRICVNRQTEGVKERPVRFETQGEADWRLLVFRRGQGDGMEGLSGFVGIALRRDDDKGVVVAMVLEGSPALKAGLKKDDVILRVGDQEATGVREVVEMVRRVRPGSELTLRIRRDGKERDVTVRVGVMPFSLLDQ
jgi:uncharacterized protein (TIGR03067 family)